MLAMITMLQKGGRKRFEQSAIVGKKHVQSSEPHNHMDP